MSEEVDKTESGLSEKDQKILSMLTPGERIILERLLELHPSDEAFDLFEMMRSEKPGEEIPTYYFSNPDPYFEREPLPADHVDHEKHCDESGTLHVQNFSANELPEITLTKEIGGTVYTVTGSYDGIELLDKKLERIMEQNMTGAEAEE